MMTRRPRAAATAPQMFIRFCVFCLLSSVFYPLNAEDLPDPTRPPANIIAPATGEGAGTRREITASSLSGLHTIIISEARRAAIIDGNIVELGGVHGDAKLIEVNESGVVLQHPNRRQVLTLFPDVKITRKETPDKESSKIESPNNKAQVQKPSSASKVQSRKHKAKPTAHYEKFLSGHPKEEK